MPAGQSSGNGDNFAISFKDFNVGSGGSMTFMEYPNHTGIHYPPHPWSRPHRHWLQQKETAELNSESTPLLGPAFRGFFVLGDRP